MKKTYTKPEISFESFAMSTNIAGSCELDTKMPTADKLCGYPINGSVIFVEGTQCTRYPSGGVYDGFCYHVPVEGKHLFNS